MLRCVQIGRRSTVSQLNQYSSSMTEGASGGPWFTAHGQLGSVNKGNGNGYTLGTYLGSEAHQIYTQANAQ